jgi:hypothetical protein
VGSGRISSQAKSSQQQATCKPLGTCTLLIKSSQVKSSQGGSKSRHLGVYLADQVKPRSVKPSQVTPLGHGTLLIKSSQVKSDQVKSRRLGVYLADARDGAHEASAPSLQEVTTAPWVLYGLDVRFIIAPISTAGGGSGGGLWERRGIGVEASAMGG